MNDYLYLLIILFIFVIILYYSNRNNDQYLIDEGFGNSKVYIGHNPIKTNRFFYNNNNFGSNSIYEVGKIEIPNHNYNEASLPHYYSDYYSNYYTDYYSNYY